jgi:hypothetical protein
MTHRLRRCWILFFLAFLLLAGCGREEATSISQQPTANSQQPTVNSQRPTVQREEMIVLETATGTPTAADTSTPPPTSVPTGTSTVTATPTPVYPVYEGAPLERDNMGVQIHIHREDMREIVGHLRALGIGWVKVQVSWKLYESEPGQYTADRLGELDRLVDVAAANDIKVLLSVSKAPEWSRPTTELDGPPIDYGRYTEFMAFLAGRYEGRVAAYELWNEPNLQREWNGSPLNAPDLVRLIGSGAAGVRTADPAAIVISGAPATTGINDGITAVDDRVFLRGMLEAGIGNHVDAVGVHPYGWANPPDSTVKDPDTAVPSHNNHPSFFFADTLNDYAAFLKEYNVDRPLWVTEFGWGSFEGIVDDDGDPASPPMGAEYMAYVSEWQQAEYILGAYELAQGWEHVGPMVLWNLNFGPTLGNEFSESGYSLLRPDGSARPSYLALQATGKN